MTGSRGKDAAGVWSSLLSEAAADTATRREDCHVLFLGHRGSGLTSLLSSLQAKREVERYGGVGFDACHVELRSKDPLHSNVGDAVHLQISSLESLQYAHLLPLAAPARHLDTLTVAIVVNIANPATAMQSAEQWLALWDKYVDEMCAANPSVASALAKRRTTPVQWFRSTDTEGGELSPQRAAPPAQGQDEARLARIRHPPSRSVPIVFVATHGDVLQQAATARGGSEALSRLGAAAASFGSRAPEAVVSFVEGKFRQAASEAKAAYVSCRATRSSSVAPLLGLVATLSLPECPAVVSELLPTRRCVSLEGAFVPDSEETNDVAAGVDVDGVAPGGLLLTPLEALCEAAPPKAHPLLACEDFEAYLGELKVRLDSAMRETESGAKGVVPTPTPARVVSPPVHPPPTPSTAAAAAAAHTPAQRPALAADSKPSGPSTKDQASQFFKAITVRHNLQKPTKGS